MHAAFRQAVRWNALTLNPSDGVTPPEARAPKTITPTPAQIRSLIAQADESFRAPLQLAAHTGMRRGELLATRWEDVSLDGAYPHVLVRGSLQRIGGVLEIVAPKTERAHRRIPLSHSAVSLLRSVRREQSERRLLVGGAWHDEGLVFDRYDGQPLDPDALTHAFQAARRRAKLEGVRLHDLRHAWATEQMRAQTNPRIVSDALGHATVAFTMQAYSHPDERMAHAAAEAIEAAFRE
jgi:integrase